MRTLLVGVLELGRRPIEVPLLGERNTPGVTVITDQQSVTGGHLVLAVGVLSWYW